MTSHRLTSVSDKKLSSSNNSAVDSIDATAVKEPWTFCPRHHCDKAFCKTAKTSDVTSLSPINPVERVTLYVPIDVC